MKKATQPLARRHRRSRHRTRRRMGNYDDFGAAGCSTVPRGTRNVLGTVGGALVGLATVAAGFFAVTSQDRALQKAAGAPMPKPGILTGIVGVGAAVGGALGGRYIATRKPAC